MSKDEEAKKLIETIFEKCRQCRVKGGNLYICRKHMKEILEFDDK